MRFEVVIESVAPAAPFAADDQENVLSGPLRFDNRCVDVFRCIASGIVFLDGLILACEQKGKQKQGVHIQHDTTSAARGINKICPVIDRPFSYSEKL